MPDKILVAIYRLLEILGVAGFGASLGAMLYAGEALPRLVVPLILSACAAAIAAPLRDKVIGRTIYEEVWHELRPDAMEAAQKSLVKAGWRPANQPTAQLIPEDMLASIDELARSAETAAQASADAKMRAEEVRLATEVLNARLVSLEGSLGAEEQRRERAEEVLRGIGEHLAGNGYRSAIEPHGEVVALHPIEAPPEQSDDPGPMPAFLAQPIGEFEDDLRAMLNRVQREPEREPVG